MTKGNKTRGNREVKKPKKTKEKTAAPNSSLMSKGTLNIGDRKK